MEDIYPSDDHELASMCGTWQQLYFLKKRRDMQKSGKAEEKDLGEMTRSERKIWYRSNQDSVELERAQASQCSNYRQLLLMQGKGILEPEELEETKSSRILWYRNGGKEQLDDERRIASQCANWQQYYLLTRGPSFRRQMEDEIESEDIQQKNAINLPTKSQKVLWYRNGGEQMVDYERYMASNSENWLQYKLTRDAARHRYNLDTAVQTKYSDFKNKGEVSEYMTAQTTQGLAEREEIRTEHRSRMLRDSVTKEAYGYRVQPYVGIEVEEERKRSMMRKEKQEIMAESLRMITEEVMTSRTRYTESARELAMKAIREDEERIAASRTKRRTMVVQSSQAAVTASS